MKFWTAPAGLHIAPGEVGDAEQLANLHARAFYRGWPVSDFTQYLNEPARTPAYVATNPKRRIAGFAMLRLAGDESELLTVVVDPKFRGRGVARALLSAAFDDLLMTPVTRMFLEVEDANRAAIALYQGFGFECIGMREGYYERPGGKPATALVMRRTFD